VKGKHWGGFRIGFSLEKTAAAKQSLLMSLLSIMGIILVVSVVGIVISVNRSLAPLKEFTKIASELAEGKVDKPIISRSKDEIGVLADVLERVRMSLKAAMDRLSR
ncbi:MAG TPA: HAMP domain-containing protein, partial [Geobacteraceae bacterium]